MRKLLQLLSWVALAGNLLPAILFMQGRIDLAGVHRYMLLATIAWFVLTPFWMERKS